MREVKIIKVPGTGKRKNEVDNYMLQTDGENYIFRKHLVSGYTPCGVPEGYEIAYNIPNKKSKRKIPYLRKFNKRR